MRRPSVAWGLGALGLTGLGLVGALQTHRDRLAFLLLLAFAASWALLVWALRSRTATGPWVIAMAALAVALRIGFLACPHDTLSDDAWRYLWDGRILRAGVNPYDHPPSQEGNPALRADTLRARVPHAQFRTIYPPGAQALFAAGHALGGGNPWGLKLLWIPFDILAAWLLWILRRDPGILLLYLLSPLVLVEGYGAAHLDLAVMALLLAGFVAVERRRPWLGATLLAASVLAKYTALPAVLAILGAAGWRLHKGRGGFRWILGLLPPLLWAVLLMALAFLPFRAAGGHLFEQVGIYARSWWFNGPLNPFLGTPGNAIAPWIRAALVGTVLLVAMARSGLRPERRVKLALLGLFLASAALFPWYLLLLLPFVLLDPRPSELWLLGAVFLSYHVLPAYHAQGLWHEDGRFTLLEFAPYALLMLSELLRGGYVSRPEDRGGHPRPE